MEKRYSNIYPKIEEEQFDLKRALISMLNCRRYLESKGFDEVGEGGLFKNWQGDPYYTSCIFGTWGEIRTDYGIIGEEFGRISDTKTKNGIIEKMIQGNPKLYRYNGRFPGWGDDCVVRTAMGSNVHNHNNVFRFFLSIIDTKDKKMTSIYGPKPSKFKLLKREKYKSIEIPNQFSFEYMMYVRKNIISPRDLVNLDKYKTNLEYTIKQNNLLTYSSKIAQGRKPPQKGIEIPQPIQLDFIDPWKIEIPKYEKKKSKSKSPWHLDIPKIKSE